MILDDKAKKRLVKNILASLEDTSKMTRPTALWLSQNYLLRHNSWPIDINGWNRPSKEDMAEFHRVFNLFHWIESDVDMNYALAWITKWFNENTYPDQENDISGRFRQRIEVVHELRTAIGLGEYHVKFQRIDWKNRYKKWITKVRARSLDEAVKLWRDSHRNSTCPGSDKYILKKIRKVSNTAWYMIPVSTPKRLFEVLTKKN
jgi:hypothetical protein